MKVGVDIQIEGTLLAGRITDYLEQHDKSADAQVLQETVNRMRQVIVRDLMQPRDTRAGKESNTLYSGPCARKSRLTFDGAEREPLRARTVMKFLLGDLVELSVLAVARLAGCHIEDNNIDLSITGRDGKPVPVHPDGRYVAEDGTQYNIEIKSCDSKTFDSWLAQNGPDDTWGYLTQASVEVAAWREQGVPMNGTLFVAVSTGTRQGSIAEFYKPYDAALVEAWHDRRDQAQAQHVPGVPFVGQPEMEFIKGKEIDPQYFTYGEPTPRLDKNGKTHGWDVYTGRTVVPMVCAYCDFMLKHCWRQAVMEMDGSKPRWIVPDPDAPGGPPTTGPAEAGGQEHGASHPPADPSDVMARAAEARRMLATLDVDARAINEWYRQCAADIKLVVYDDYRHALKQAGKAK
jgi:hypothetical protein